GSFIYKSKEYGELLTVQLSEPEKYLSTFKKLKQAVESGAFDKKSSTKTSSNTSKANSTTAKTNSASSKTNSTSVSTKTPAQTATVKKEDNTPYTATVTNPRYYLRKPGQNVSEWLINYDVVNSRQMDRWNYLYVQNADTKQWLNSKKTGKKWFRSSANGNSMLTFSLSADDLPPATETKPVRLKMWIYMATPSTEGWIGSFATPVFIWDGKYMRQETSDQTTTVKNEDNTLYTAKVNNPRYQLRKPGQNVGYEWLINCNVTTSPQMDCGVYLYVQNADTKQWYKNRKTGNDWFKYYFNDNRMLTFELTDDELPPATKEKPVRLKMWIFMSTYYVDGWTGSFETPVFIWDGKYMRQE
ncbi:MAG: hypothetical protein K2K00_07635, partial [Muribaculaceae bacterium]|nr:hypothetical protein [Muribaculaceae bacterium]